MNESKVDTEGLEVKCKDSRRELSSILLMLVGDVDLMSAI